MFNFNQIIRFYNRLDSHSKELVNGSFTSFLLRISGAILAFILNIALGRMMGANGVGLYFQALSVASIAMVLGRVGLDNTLLRYAAASSSLEDWVSTKGLLVKSLTLTLFVSALLTLVVYLLAPWLGRTAFSDVNLINPLRLMVWAIVPTAIYTIVAQMLQGIKRAKDGIAILSVWAPAFCLVGAFFLVPRLGINGAVLAYDIAAALAVLIAWYRWRKATPQLRGVKGVFSTGKLLKSSMPLFWVTLAQLAISYTSTFTVAIWSTSANVGIYGAASRMVLLVNFVLLAVNSIASPKFASLFQQGDMLALAKLAKGSTKLLIFAASPFFFLFWFAPSELMMLFGKEFATGASVISILAIGQLVNIITGPAGNVLMMTGHESMVRNTMFVSALICIAISWLLVPSMGIVGAAIANTITVSIENLIMVALVWRMFGFLTIPVPFIGKKVQPK